MPEKSPATSPPKTVKTPVVPSRFSIWVRRIVLVIILLGLSRAVVLWLMFSDRVLYEPGRQYEYAFQFKADEMRPDGAYMLRRWQLSLKGSMSRSVIRTRHGTVLIENKVHVDSVSASLDGDPSPVDEEAAKKFLERTYVTSSDVSGRNEELVLTDQVKDGPAIVLQKFFALWRTPLPAAPALQWRYSQVDPEGRGDWRGEIDLPCSFLTLHDACLRLAPKKVHVPEGENLSMRGETIARYDAWHRRPVTIDAKIKGGNRVGKEMPFKFSLELSATIHRSTDLAAQDVQRLLDSRP